MLLLRSIIVFWLFSATVLANEPELSAQQWLEKMSLSMKTLNYQGTVAFFKNGRLDTMKYFHAIDNGQEQERQREGQRQKQGQRQGQKRRGRGQSC